MSTTERAAKVLQEIDFALARVENVTAGPWVDGWEIEGATCAWQQALRCLKTSIEGLLSVAAACPVLEPSPLLREHVAACLTTLCDQWDSIET